MYRVINLQRSLNDVALALAEEAGGGGGVKSLEDEMQTTDTFGPTVQGDPTGVNGGSSNSVFPEMQARVYVKGHPWTH
jgi:hypothetical protein